MNTENRLPVRARVACSAGRAAAKLSRLLGRGAGGMVGGKVALRIAPDLLHQLSAGKHVTLVTGTNGKTSTTKFTMEAMRTLGDVATNQNGDNMTTGILTALMENPTAPYCVLEVDEMHLAQIVAATDPQVLILLNLSRDQLDRVGEIGTVEGTIRKAVDNAPRAVVVANCDDPLISSAAWDAKNVQWVSVGAPWLADSASFPRTGTIVIREGDEWHVDGAPEYSRPQPDWTVSDAEADGSFELQGADGTKISLYSELPGRANRGNAGQAAVAALAAGVKPEALARALRSVTGVAGRYQTYEIDGRSVRMLMAKNPAGWQEAMTMVSLGAPQLVIAVNGQIPDGEDLSWLWDVDFAALRKQDVGTIIASGERAADLAVRLEYDGFHCTVVDSPLEAVKAFEPGKVEVLANYSAFRDLKKELDR